MKYLIVGLGNIGSEYENTRHNIGFDVVDRWAQEAGVKFEICRHAMIAEVKHKGRTVILAKPTTYMNLSGKAVKYWMQEENISLENVCVITDDIDLPIAKTRLKPKGGPGSHNGLTNIVEVLNTPNFNRLRFGIGKNYSRGRQVDYVLGNWEKGEAIDVDLAIDKTVDALKSFVSIGIERTMNTFN